MCNAADKREALEREIAATQAANVQLEHEAAACAESVEPLKARREQRAQCVLSLPAASSAPHVCEILLLCRKLQNQSRRSRAPPWCTASGERLRCGLRRVSSLQSCLQGAPDEAERGQGAGGGAGGPPAGAAPPADAAAGPLPHGRRLRAGGQGGAAAGHPARPGAHLQAPARPGRPAEGGSAILSVAKGDRTCVCCAGLRNHPPEKVPLAAFPGNMARCADACWSLIAA